MGWQPIETAPKDGSDIWIYSPHEYPTKMVAYWYSDEFFSAWMYRDTLLVDVSPEGVDRPTHWMPLTNPPVQS